MTLDEQLKLKRLQDKGYEILWEDSPYVAEIGSGQVAEITESFIDAKDFQSPTYCGRVGEFVYSDSAVFDVFLATCELSEFCAFMRHDSDEFDNLLSEG